ncbi:chaperonin 10-like protein [Aspergillus recurvatus]
MASKTENIALYVDENVKFAVRRQQEMPAPGDGEILVETLFSGTNPADIKHATLLGIYPAVLGYDFCGRVLKTSSGTSFRPGDLVAGYTPTGINRPTKYGAHQRYLVCPGDMAFSVPAGLPPQHAACLTVVAMTAADALFNILNFAPPYEKVEEQKAAQPLLIWGASSSVGLSALQLARASGIHPIIVTASPERHDQLRELGATHCFDYKSPSITSDIRALVGNWQWGALTCGLDAVGSEKGVSSARLMAECCSEDATLVSVVVQRDPRFRMPLATPNRDLVIKVPEVPHPITIPARPAAFQCAWRVLRWAVENYGVCFRFPSVDVFEGTAEEALEELMAMAGHGRGFGKLVLKHPLQ